MMNKLAKQKKDVKTIMFSFGCAKELAEDMVFNGRLDPAVHTDEIIEYLRGYSETPEDREFAR